HLAGVLGRPLREAGAALRSRVGGDRLRHLLHRPHLSGRPQPATSRARRNAPTLTSTIATITATTATTNSTYIRLFATPPPNSSPRPPKSGPTSDAIMLPQAVTISAQPTTFCARAPRRSCGVTAAPVRRVRPFR